MTEVLVFGEISPAMETALDAHFARVHRDDVDLATEGARFEYALTNGGLGISAEDMAHLTGLKLVSNYGVGYDGIDAKAAAARGVLVTHTPDVLNAEVATTTLLLMMACYRELLRDDAWVRSGRWASEGGAPLTRSLDRRKIGILGMGRIGQEIARKLAPFEPELHYHTRAPKDVPFAYHPDLVEMAREVECLILITPGGAVTHHLVNEEVMEALGPQGTLINVARGTVVDEAAMIACLADGRLGWAGLDVFQEEPHVPEALRKLPNVVLLPHVGSGTAETRLAMGQLVIDNLVDHLTKDMVRTPVPECADLAKS